MKINLNDFNSRIESWLENSFERAIDKDYYIITTLKRANMYIEYAKDRNTIFSHCDYPYQLYKLGELEEAEHLLNSIIIEYINNINEGKLPKNIMSLFEIDSDKNNFPFINKGTKQESEINDVLSEMISVYIHYCEAFRILGGKYPELLKYVKTIESITDSENDITNPTTIEVPKEIAVKHFSVFKLKNEKNKNNTWLTDEQFDTFIENIYGNSKSEKIKFNLGTGERQFIIDRFYKFYLLGMKEYNAYSRGTESYIRLLTDNFEDFNYDNVSRNFRASKANARNWSIYEQRMNNS